MTAFLHSRQHNYLHLNARCIYYISRSHDNHESGFYNYKGAKDRHGKRCNNMLHILLPYLQGSHGNAIPLNILLLVETLYNIQEELLTLHRI